VTDCSDIAVLVLAAGLSRRFGDGDKLLQKLEGRPLAFHVAETLQPLPFHRKVVVCRDAGDPLGRGFADRGFLVVVNPEPEAGQGASLALGTKAAMGAAALIVCLADMPHVARGDIENLVAAWRAAPDRPAAARAGDYFGVPALFPAAAYPALMALTGDRGARGLLADATAVAVDPAHLGDFDRPEDFG
jgi:molybdenum cofactor cytidylyltransferase